MLEYPLDEAREMLEKNLTNANTTLESTGEDTSRSEIGGDDALRGDALAHVTRRE